MGGVIGCESLQRKFVRKRKKPQAPPSPVISFRDYSQSITPLDRYRKHYLMFDYWNDQLIHALGTPPLNAKRYKHASEEALAELQTLHGLLSDDKADQLSPLLDERAKIHRQLQSPSLSQTSPDAIRRALEVQTRQLHREFLWKDVQDQLKPPESKPATAPEGPTDDAPAP